MFETTTQTRKVSCHPGGLWFKSCVGGETFQGTFPFSTPKNHPTEKEKSSKNQSTSLTSDFWCSKKSGEQWWAILNTLVASEHVLSVAMSRSPRLSTVEDHARRALVCWTVEQGAGFFWPKAPSEFYLDWRVWWLDKMRKSENPKNLDLLVWWWFEKVWNFIPNGCFNGDVPW